MTSKWVKLMTLLQWRDVTNNTRYNNWKVINDTTVEANIPHIQQWVLDNLGHVPDHDVRIAFKEFYFSRENENKPSYHYTKKERAELALAALYNYQQGVNHE